MALKLLTKDKKIFAHLLGKWVKYSQEEKLKQEFILRLINNYGYKIEQLGQDVSIKKRYKADIAIWQNEIDKSKEKTPSIIITVECKAEHIKIKHDDYKIGYNFASSINANFFIAVNLKEIKIFHIAKTASPAKIDKLSDIPRAEIIGDSKTIEKYIRESKSFTREEFTKLLTRCHNIIRNNDKLSPEAAFDEISKVLFMKIMYERSAKEEMIFSKVKFLDEEKTYETKIRKNLKSKAEYLDQDYMQYLFDETKKSFENDEIFDPKDIIRIKKNSFEMIVEELETVNLSDTSDDVKGIAFEEFLGKTFRGELGQFFTPRTIVDFMVQVLDPQEDEIICDPCCGSGGFLITAFEYIRNKIDEDIQKNIEGFKKKFSEDLAILEKIKIKLSSEFDIKSKQSRYNKLSHECIFGTDANPRMARTAKMNMIMHGDGHGGVHHRDGLLNINGIFENRFDVILTNPPFGARVEKSLLITKADQITDANRIAKYKKMYGDDVYTKAMQQLEFDEEESKGKPVLDTLHIGKEGMSGLTEVLFIERCINLLKPGGRLGIVLPEGVLNTQNLGKVRQYFESTAKIILITSIPQDVFMKSGATVKSSLVFLKKFTTDEAEQWKKITKEATKKVKAKYQSELNEIESQLALRGNDALDAEAKKELRAKKKKIEEAMEIQIRAIVKEKFDYDIPIATVEKAGISSTGAVTDNELTEILKQYTPYRTTNQLWKEVKPVFEYKWSSKTGKVERIKNQNETTKIEW